MTEAVTELVRAGLRNAIRVTVKVERVKSKAGQRTPSQCVPTPLLHTHIHTHTHTHTHKCTHTYTNMSMRPPHARRYNARQPFLQYMHMGDRNLTRCGMGSGSG
jgi:hypothetical protein